MPGSAIMAALIPAPSMTAIIVDGNSTLWGTNGPWLWRWHVGAVAGLGIILIVLVGRAVVFTGRRWCR
jgi:hypothetical protein